MKKPEPVRFEVEGAEMAVRLAGGRQKPALLLIHGFPSSSVSFRNVAGKVRLSLVRTASGKLV